MSVFDSKLESKFEVACQAKTDLTHLGIYPHFIKPGLSAM
jgi:hypothetical protein